MVMAVSSSKLMALKSIPRRGQFSTLLLWSLCSEPMGDIKVQGKGGGGLVG